MLFNKMSGEKLGLLSSWAYYPGAYCASIVIMKFQCRIKSAEKKKSEVVL